jgi:hypothetical protein
MFRQEHRSGYARLFDDRILRFGSLVRLLHHASLYSEHAEALLECYDLLQRLHEKELIDLLNGLLSASDTFT